jgi:hypothetical protein
MSNMEMGSNGIGAGDRPTAPYSVTGPPAGGPGRNDRKGRWSAGKRTAALLAVCAVAGGGAFAVTQVATGSPAATQAAATQAGFQAGTSASLTGQAATLSGALSGTGAGRIARLRRLGGMYGQYTYATKTGSHTLAFERGTITSVGSGDAVVRAANGTTWTWELISTSVVRESGKKVTESTLAAGETVFAGGPVTNGARDARLIVIRKAAAPSSSSTAPAGTA